MHHLLSAFFHRFQSQASNTRRPSSAKLGHGRAKTVFRNGEYHLTAGQLARLIAAAASERDRAMVQLLAETGLRRGELGSLDIGDLDTAQPLLTIRSGKGGKMRLVPLTTDLHVRLLRLVRGWDSGPVFQARSGSRLSLRQINRVVAAIGQRAGVANPNPRHKQITCHLLRHSFARLWKDAGGSIETLSKILGHSSVKTTMDVYGTQSLTDVQRNYAATIRKMRSK